MAPWAVSAMAGMPNSAAFAHSSSTREAPSSKEYSLCVCRWTKLSDAIGSNDMGYPRHPEQTESATRRGGENLLIKLHPCNSGRTQLTLRTRPSSRGDAARMKLSYSSINTYETCPAKYKFQYEDRLPTTSSPALSFGDVLHRTLFRFHDRPVPVAPSVDELLEMLDAEWSSDGYRDPSEERLSLYFLLPGQRMTTFRTAADAEDLRVRIATVAERIGAGKFEPRQNPLCDWCDFQPMCPLYRHKYEKERGDPAPKMTELVDE